MSNGALQKPLRKSMSFTERTRLALRGYSNTSSAGNSITPSAATLVSSSEADQSPTFSAICSLHPPIADPDGTICRIPAVVKLCEDKKPMLKRALVIRGLVGAEHDRAMQHVATELLWYIPTNSVEDLVAAVFQDLPELDPVVKLGRLREKEKKNRAAGGPVVGLAAGSVAAGGGNVGSGGVASNSTSSSSAAARDKRRVTRSDRNVTSSYTTTPTTITTAPSTASISRNPGHEASAPSRTIKKEQPVGNESATLSSSRTKKKAQPLGDKAATPRSSSRPAIGDEHHVVAIDSATEITVSASGTLAAAIAFGYEPLGPPYDRIPTNLDVYDLYHLRYHRHHVRDRRRAAADGRSAVVVPSTSRASAPTTAPAFDGVGSRFDDRGK